MTSPVLPAADDHNLGEALWRGAKCRCPRCGEGRLFTRYLKVAPVCMACGLDLSGNEADDAPPYFTITVVGHIVVPLAYAVMTNVDWPIGVHMALWPALGGLLCLLFLQPIKGAVVGYQWAMKMHGFGEEAGDSRHD